MTTEQDQPWLATLCVDSFTTEVEYLRFSTVEEWEQWVDATYPKMRENFDATQRDTEHKQKHLQVGTNNHWCSLDYGSPKVFRNP